MKKLISLLFAAVLLCSALHAKVFTFDASAGVKTGRVKEFVISDLGTISELDWNADVVPFMKASGRINVFNAVLDLSVSSAIPVRTGSIQDYDWVTSGISGIFGYPVQYSTHDCYLDKMFTLEAKTGYCFHIFSLDLLPEAGIDYRNRKFSARNGWGQYSTDGSPITDSIEKTYFSGTILSYEQQLVLPFASLEAGYTFFSGLSVALSGRVYPFIAADSIDSHYTTKTQYFDSMRGGFGFSVGTSVQYRQFGLSVEYEYMKCVSGSSKSAAVGVGSPVYAPLSTTPGTDSSFWVFTFIYRCI